MSYVLLVLLGVLIIAEIVSAVRQSRCSSAPEDGCCGCGVSTADIVLSCGETYCWSCVDTWPAGATSLADLGMKVFPGHERSSR